MTFDIENARIQELRVFESCVTGFKQILGRIATGYGKEPWPVEQVAGNQQFREMFSQENKVKLPILALHIQSMRPSGEILGFNQQVAYNGIPLGVINQNSPTPQNCILHFKSIAVDCRIILTTQTFSEVTSFAQRFLFRDREAQFTLSTNTFNLPIKVVFNEELAIPDIEFSEMGNLFMFECSVTLYCYVGVLELLPVIKKVNVTTTPTNANSTPIPNSSNTFVIKE